MYFIEILSRILKKDNLKILNIFRKSNLDNDSDGAKCNHTFVAIDSTETVYACINCGLVINKNKENKTEDIK